MATHASTLALKIPWTLALKIPWSLALKIPRTEELGAGYYPWGCKVSGTTERLHFNWVLVASHRFTKEETFHSVMGMYGGKHITFL